MSLLTLSVSPSKETIAAGAPMTAFVSVARLGIARYPLGEPVATEQPVPVSYERRPLILSLSPGAYLVSAALPNGAHLAKVVDVFHEETIDVILSEGPASTPDLGLVTKAFEPPRLGNTSRSSAVVIHGVDLERFYIDGAEELTGLPKDSELQFSHFDVEPQSASNNLIGPFTGAKLKTSDRKPSPKRTICDLTATSYNQIDDMWPWHSSSGSFKPWVRKLLDTDTVRELREDFSSENAGKRLSSLHAQHDGSLKPLLRRSFLRLERVKWYRQRYVLARSGYSAEQIAVVPIDWGGQELVAQVSDFWNSESNGWSLRLDVADGHFASLLGYFSTGDLARARQVISGGLQELFEKTANPYAAVASAYVLIYSSKDDIPAYEWPRWIQNLATWYPAIPDAQILLATLYLQRRGVLGVLDRHDQLSDLRRLEIVWKLLKLATTAGIPVYSMGVRLLVENLEILSYEIREIDSIWSANVEEIDRLLGEARFIASCIKSVQPFTVLTVPAAERFATVYA